MIADNRKTFTLTGKKLRRARHLYMFFCAPYIKNTIDINYVACRMLEEGLYARTTSLKDIRYHILRKMWRLDGGISTPYPNTDDWFNWLQRKGWYVGYWERYTKVQASMN